MSFGKNLKTARKKKGLKQFQLTQLSGVRENSISMYETGRSIPSVITAVKLAKALGVTCEQLVSDEAEFLNTISDKSLNNLSENGIEKIKAENVDNNTGKILIEITLPRGGNYGRWNNFEHKQREF